MGVPVQKRETVKFDTSRYQGSNDGELYSTQVFYQGGEIGGGERVELHGNLSAPGIRYPATESQVMAFYTEQINVRLRQREERRQRALRLSSRVFRDRDQVVQARNIAARQAARVAQIPNWNENRGDIIYMVDAVRNIELE